MPASRIGTRANEHVELRLTVAALPQQVTVLRHLLFGDLIEALTRG